MFLTLNFGYVCLHTPYSMVCNPMLSGATGMTKIHVALHFYGDVIVYWYGYYYSMRSLCRKVFFKNVS